MLGTERMVEGDFESAPIHQVGEHNVEEHAPRGVEHLEKGRGSSVELNREAANTDLMANVNQEGIPS